jgi:hypothetical protein
MQLVPVRVECIFSGYNDFEYTGISIKFDEISEGFKIPKYRLDMRSEAGEDGIDHVVEVIASKIED